jgi:GTP cyclohydrolase IA
MNIENSIRELLKLTGEDPDREGLSETPQRFLKAFDFWTQGYEQDPGEVLKMFEDGAEYYDQLIFIGNIPVYSLCEHHLTPFFGVAHVGYIPDQRIVGLSKIPRLVDVFARRLQCQERLTRQIADAIWDVLQPLAVGAVIRCRHLCMESRGIQKSGCTTVTSALRGALRDEPDCRAEFMTMVATADDGKPF